MPHLHDSTNIQAVLFKHQASDPSAPASGFLPLYEKSDELYYRVSGGTVYKLAASTGGMADAVVLTPGSSTRNVVQPSGDFKALIVKNNAAQAVNPQEWQASSGTMQAAIAANGDFVRSGAAGTARAYSFQTAGSKRWEFATNTSGESGSDNGSDFLINRYNDSGSLLDFAFAVIRNSGQTWIRYKDSGTNNVVTSLLLNRSSSGTPAAGFGYSITFQGKSSAAEDRNMGRVRYHWTVATDASRTARGTLSAYDTAERDCIAWEASGSAAMIGVLGAAPVVRQTSGANLINNVTSGGTDDTIANYTDLTTYANDAAAIRNNIYQLARKLKQVNDALRLFGWLT